MEETLVVYDNNGTIFTMITGSFIVPQGLQHMVIEIPEGKILSGVNVTTHTPIYIDAPPSLETMVMQRFAEIDQALIDLDNAIGGGGGNP